MPISRRHLLRRFAQASVSSRHISNGSGVPPAILRLRSQALLCARPLAGLGPCDV